MDGYFAKRNGYFKLLDLKGKTFVFLLGFLRFLQEYMQTHHSSRPEIMLKEAGVAYCKNKSNNVSAGIRENVAI
jgi:hypothetical protein